MAAILSQPQFVKIQITVDIAAIKNIFPTEIMT